MKNYTYLLILSMLSFLAACSQKPTSPVSANSNTTAVNSEQLVRLDIHIDGDHSVAQVYTLDPLTSQVLHDADVNETQKVVLDSSNAVVTHTLYDGKRYISVPLSLTNHTGKDLDDIYFVARDPNNNPPQTPFTDVRDALNQPITTPASMTLAHARTYSNISQRMKISSSDYVTHLDIANSNITNKAGLRTEGFLAKNSDRTSTFIANGARGQVTFSAEVGTLAVGEDAPFSFSIFFYTATNTTLSNVCSGNFFIDNINTASDIDAVKDCTIIDGDLTITATTLNDLTALQNNLQHITGRLIISCDILDEYFVAGEDTTLSTLHTSSALTTLHGLNNLTTIGTDLMIGVNSNLSSLAGLHNLQSVGGSLYIYNNNNLTSLAEISNLQFIGNDLDISINPTLTTLNGLENITFIEGRLSVRGNYELDTLRGLNNITSVGGSVDIMSLRSLVSLEGLNTLNSIGHSLTISHNNTLVNLNGLNSLMNTGSVNITNNNLLTNVNRLFNLTSIEGHVSINSNRALTNLYGLINISSIGGSLRIINNAVLPSLTGLNSNRLIGGGLLIQSNSSLINIDALDNTTVEGSSKSIVYNAQLDCTSKNNAPPSYFPVTSSTGNQVNCTTF